MSTLLESLERVEFLVPGHDLLLQMVLDKFSVLELSVVGGDEFLHLQQAALTDHILLLYLADFLLSLVELCLFA